MAARKFSASSFLQRWIAALVVVFATFNPTGYSYAHWLQGPAQDSLPFKVIAGIALAIVYIVFIRATWRSIGPIGLLLAAALLGAVVWTLFYYGIIALQQTTALSYIALVVVATILALGLSWSHIRRRLSGQVDTDDVEE